MSLPTPQRLERVLLESVDREADADVIDREDWIQVRTPSSQRTDHNKIVLARLAAGAVDEAITAVQADHAARGASYWWTVGPSSRPRDLGERLVAHGLHLVGHTLGMAIAVPSDDAALGVAGLSVHALDASTIDEFADVTTDGWQKGPEFREAVAEIATKSLIPGAQVRSWIARLDGRPVATSHLRLLDGIGYFQGCAVVPDARRRGIYRALLNHRLAFLRTFGIPVAVVWADAAGSGIACAKLGFQTICTADFYESTPG